MFGMHPELERRLRKHGARAGAQVLAAEQGHVTVSDGTMRAADVEANWTLKLQVQPAGAPPFEADVDALFNQFDSPSVGQMLPVFYDPDDHTKVVVDRSEGGQVDAAAETIASRLGSRGMHVDSTQLASLLKQNEDHPGSVDPAAMRAAMGVPPGDGPVNLSTVAGVPPTPTAPVTGDDPVELLDKLAEMHRNGEVDDEEFAAQKKRLLGE